MLRIIFKLYPYNAKNGRLFPCSLYLTHLTPHRHRIRCTAVSTRKERERGAIRKLLKYKQIEIRF
ncbi:hypothetical protein HMPREF0658_1750 [Hoylesella marshii DSM 16973 = JCM 13450]|uniref:Uncharacterized protein n=1 Tax=Hoylesella marshii DSM 16973 = JCM 13450 TaxID=862515 RepID=E0NU97_9BACT|nr:hypothetical protein HMPREF0658_1750 [Hoylesella marshii DSM 16973 = JCM 13450]